MSNMYNTGLEALIDGGIQWGTTAMKVMLVTTSYTFDADHDDRADITNEITNTGYTAGGNALAGESTTVDDANDECTADATNTTFSSISSGDQPGRAIVYKNVGTASNDLVLTCNTLTSPPAPNGGDYTIVWDSEGVFELSN